MVVVAGLLAACGQVQKLPPPTDGGGSGPGIDAQIAPVTVTVLSIVGDGAPDATAKVVFQDPQGAVVFDGPVDAMGHAQALLPSGGTVSAIRITADTATELTAAITTTRGVQPGDDLTFGLKAFATITNQGASTSMSATFQPAENATTSTLYTFYTPCGSLMGRTTASPATLSFRDSCHGDTFDLLATALVGTVPMYLDLTGVAYRSGDSINIPVPFQAMKDFTVNMTNVPNAVSSMNVARASLIGNLPISSLNTTLSGVPLTGAVSATVSFPQGFGTRSELAISMGSGDAISQRYEAHTATLGTSAAVDLGTLQLPWISNLAQTPTGATWTTVTAAGSPDGMMTEWSGQWNDGTRPVTIVWRTVQPVELTGAMLPTLPVAYAKLDPGQQTAAVTLNKIRLWMVDYDKVAGYDQLRLMPENLLIPNVGDMGAFVGTPFQRRIIISPP